MIVEMKEEDETTFTDVVITAINNEYVRRLRRRIRAEKKARVERGEAESSGED